MVNEAYFSVAGYIATNPKLGYTRDGTRTLSMRVGWTPRRLDRATGEWMDQPSSFISVQCFRKVAEHAGLCLRRGDPVVIKGTLRVREYSDQTGLKRTSVDVVAETIGHDLSRGITFFTRASASQEQTAAEREQAEGERDPLPGDRQLAQGSAQFAADGALPGAGPGLADGVLADGVLADGARPGPDPLPAGGVPGERDVDDPDFEADDDTFDLEEDSVRTLTEPAEQNEPAEPVPALV